MSSGKLALIAGGGLGGLSAAIALKRVGWRVLVLERAPEIKDVGAGLQIWANASDAMTKFGVLDAFTKASCELSEMTMNDRRGRLLMDMRLKDVERETGFKAYNVHRHDLVTVLSSFLDASDIRLDSEFRSYRFQDGKVTVMLRNGETIQGDVLIGADGINSRVREELQRDTGKARKPVYRGYVAYRGIAPHPVADRPKGCSALALGGGMQSGFFPMVGARTFWFATFNAPFGEALRGRAGKEQILKAMKGWCYPYSDIIDATQEDTILQNDICDYEPSSQWGRDVVTLLGDAAHATTPNLGQGACMAIEDAVELARRLARATDIPAALRGYEAARTVRTSMVVRRARKIGESVQNPGMLAGLLRDLSMRTAPKKAIFKDVLAIQGYRNPELR